MRKWLRRSGYVLVILAASNLPAACHAAAAEPDGGDVISCWRFLCWVLLMMVVLRPLGRESPHPAHPDPGGGRRTAAAVPGDSNRQCWLRACVLGVCLCPGNTPAMEGAWGFWSVSIHILAVVVAEAAVFWAGMPRGIDPVQLGLKHRYWRRFAAGSRFSISAIS